MSTGRNQPPATLQEMIDTLSERPIDRTVEDSSVRVWRRINTNIAQPRRGLRLRVGLRPSLALSLLVPAAMFIVGLLIGSQPRGFDFAFGRNRAVNVHVSVDAEHTDELLSWLNGQDQVGQVNVSLPDQAEFRFQGEPVLLRSLPHRPELTADQGEGTMEIIPMEEAP